MRSADRFPDRPALLLEGRAVSYRELQESALRIAATLGERSPGTAHKTPLTAVLGSRTPATFAGVLGALLAGHGYVPLNPEFPPARTQRMLEASECRTIVADAASIPQVGMVLQEAEERLVVLLPDVTDTRALSASWPRHEILGAADLLSPAAWDPPTPTHDATAYLLFTSGSTGSPKGVVVAQRNVLSFVDFMVDRYRVTEEDRFSQMFDLTFDLSAFDMFVCWDRGACLCCPSRKDLISPAQFIDRAQLTVWFSVPSTAIFMKRLGLLRPSRYSSLRLSLFCGEPLPLSIATAWREAAPGSVLENLYGPTELTIACTYYRWDDARSPAECELGIVPIGEPYPGMTFLVVDEELREVAPGSEGELVMTGPQMSLGYWDDVERTAAAFVRLPGQEGRYYRTGDRVRRPIGNRPLTHLGRMDAQVKIRGHRVELGEIEATVRESSGLEGVVATPWPVTPSGYGAVEVFIEGHGLDVDRLRSDVAARLPEYMVPRRFHVLEELPRNANGKYDRRSMAALLEEGL